MATPASFHQRYELDTGEKTKVVEIWREKHMITTRTSAAGARAKQQVTPHKSQPAAIAEVDRVTKALEAEGYVAMLDDRGRPKAKKRPKRDALEAAILANPDDVAAYQVYADWLIEEGDPFGEFITVQIGRSEEPDAKKLIKREEAFVKAHGKEWLGELFGAHEPLKKGQKPLVKIEWNWGFMHGVHIHGSAPSFYRQLRKLRAARMIRELGIDFMSGLGRENIGTALLESGLPPRLEFLGLVGEPSTPRGSLNLEKLMPALGALEHLIVAGHRIRFGKAIALPHLKSFVLSSTRFQREDLAALANANWPRLESFGLTYGDVLGCFF